MDGLHLTADLRGCDAGLPLMLAPEALRRLCLDAVAAAGLGAVGELFHRFAPAPGCAQTGITGVVLLAESHLAVHTWPELGGVTIDVYVCNLGADNSARAALLMAALVEPFGATDIKRQALQRGV
ncbi:adenosylmethionine decarboxylase [soil metagenome]